MSARGTVTVGGGWRRDLADIRQTHASAVAGIRERLTPTAEKRPAPVAEVPLVATRGAGDILIPAHLDTRRNLREPVQETDTAGRPGSWLV